MVTCGGIHRAVALSRLDRPVVPVPVPWCSGAAVLPHRPDAEGCGEGGEEAAGEAGVHRASPARDVLASPTAIGPRISPRRSDRVNATMVPLSALVGIFERSVRASSGSASAAM